MSRDNRTDAEWYAAPSAGMASVHRGFKAAFAENHRLADGTFHKYGMSLQGFLHHARAVAQSLDGHHRGEERSIFPVLARHHPAFRESSAHVASHRVIHDGLARYNAYLDKATRDPKSYSAAEFRAVIDSFKEPMERHLDQEVRDLEPTTLRMLGVPVADLKRLPF
ncbi:hypothetical protein CspeluHIS016_0402190 [Cutaneotrichosporon spelunceum]|uniref:Hemerythrin-like domain-containing protein n=1 Tax=Cutaneotrichosporon spelunceum TaxID=1672016 RepID=A0AAD3TVR6_9TREE|nr:hypothetical protein CspeluHIS016_0402190 [Cutaneotrichosporon spelunceum]